MNHNIAILKVANAIRDYRGAFHVQSGKWIHPPKAGSWSRVAVAISRLKKGEELIRANGIEHVKSMVDGFKNQDEMNSFISNL